MRENFKWYFKYVKLKYVKEIFLFYVFVCFCDSLGEVCKYVLCEYIFVIVEWIE